VRKIAEVLVVYSMHNKGIRKDTLKGRWFFHSQLLPFYHWFCYMSGAAEIEISLCYIHTVHCAIHAVFD